MFTVQVVTATLQVVMVSIREQSCCVLDGRDYMGRTGNNTGTSDTTSKVKEGFFYCKLNHIYDTIQESLHKARHLMKNCISALKSYLSQILTVFAVVRRSLCWNLNSRHQ